MNGSRRRVLVVDDEPDVQDFVRMVLEQGGYDVACADNGEQALARIRDDKPDLVVLDLMMPVMDGWTVLEELGGKLPPPVVVILSAAADAIRAERAGASGCISKPFRPAHLLATCRDVLCA